jgi:hypothetical protein
MIDELVQGVFEGAGQELRLQIDGNQARAGVDGFVAGHGVVSASDRLMTLDIHDGSRQDARIKRLFLQLRWASQVARLLSTSSSLETYLIARLAVSVAIDRLTATWQLSVLPNCPQYCRATPTECVPCLGIPVSSAIRNTVPAP